MKREDFNTNVEWVIYKVTGKLPDNSTPLSLEDHKLPNRKNDVKFYYNKSNGRYAVSLDNNYICACGEDDIPNVQKDFDKEFNGNNLDDVSLMLRRKYNLNMRNQTYQDANISFERKGKRLSARITHDGKSHVICSCYPNQKRKVSRDYDALKQTRDLESIKDIMKNKYNLKIRDSRMPNHNLGGHTISLDDNGAIYKDGQFCKVDPKLYEYINKFIGE